MRVYLAVQVVSSTMARLIERHAAEAGGRAKYASILELIKRVDRLVDIFNGTRQSKRNGQDKGCENIDCRKHPLLKELLETLCIFAKWKKESGMNSSHFIPYTLYDDLCSMVFGLVGLSQMYLSDVKGTHRLVQRRGNTDVNEHLFGHVRAREREFTLDQARRFTSKANGMRLNGFVFGQRGNNRDAATQKYSWSKISAGLTRTSSK